MKLTIDRLPLSRELRLVASAAERRSTISALTHVLLTAKGGTLRLAATDLDTAMLSTLSAEVEEPGAVAVPARKLHGLIRSLKAEAVDLATEEVDRLVITGNNTRIVLHGKPEEEFPSLPEVPAKVTVRFDFAEILPAIKAVCYAVSAEESRFQLNGALFETGRGKRGARMVATDSHRLALAELPKRGRVSSKLVHRDALALLTRIKGAESVDYTAGEHHIAFRVEGREIISRVLDGTFPDYSRVLDDHRKKCDKTTEVDRAEMLAKLETICLMTGKYRRAMILEGGPRGFVLSVDQPDAGSVRVEMTTEWSGKAVRMGINPEYLADFMASVDSERVRLEMADEHSCVFTFPVGDDSVTAIVMPMKI